MKKTLVLCAVVLTMVLTLVAFAVPASAETYQGTWGTMTWKIDATKGEMTITGSGDMNGTSGNNAFAIADSLRSSIKTVKLDSRITAIGNKVFYGFDGLENIVLPEGLTRIGSNAFYNCASLRTITLPSSLMSIGSNAFNGCVRLVDVVNRSQTLTVTAGATSNGYVGYYAKSVSTTASQLVKSGNYTFLTVDGIHYLTDYTGTDTVLTLPESYNGATYRIYDYAFAKESTLRSVALPSFITEIGTGMFSDCTGLTSLSLTKNISSIGEYAYANCASLTEVEIPLTVTAVSSYAFQGCKGLSEIAWPAHLTTVPVGVFKDCTLLQKVTFEETLTELGASCFSGCSALQGIMLPEGLEIIGATAFDGCWGISYIDIPMSVTAIGNGAFGRTGLTSVTIPETVTSIGTGMFQHCYALTEVSLPEGMSEIPSMTFYACSALTYVRFPSTVTSIGANAFNASGLYSFELPPQVTSIGNFAFSYCYNLTYFAFHSNFTEIPTGMFQYDAALESLYFMDSIVSIGDNAFDGCKALGDIQLPTGLTTIGTYAFQDCASIKMLSLPASIQKLGSYALNRCSSLEKLTYCGTADTWASVNKGNGWSGYATAYDLSYHLYADDCDGDCDICWEWREAPHHYDNACDYDCNECGASRNVGDHVYDNDCDESCNECGSIREVYHSYDNECDATCNSCGAYRYVSGHWYDHDCDADCNSCGAIRPVTHTYDDVCDPECNSCGETRIPPHNYVDGYCDLCKAEDPNYSGGGDSGEGGDTSDTFMFEELADGTYRVLAGEGLLKDPSVTKLVIPSEYNGKAVTVIGGWSFHYLPITSVTIPESVVEIEDCAFQYNYALMSVTFLGNNVKRIGSAAFAECSMLETIELPEGLTQLDSMAFKNCISLRSITIPTGVEVISAETFYGCGALTSVTLNEGLKTIDDYAFACSGAWVAEFPSTLETIGAYAFQECSFASVLKIPTSLKLIKEGAFTGVYGLTEVYYDGTLAEWCQIKFKNMESNPVFFAGVLNYSGQKVVSQLLLSKDVPSIEYTLPELKDVTEIYFEGSPEDWEYCFTDDFTFNWMKNGSRTVYFYSKTEPEREGSFWYYDQNNDIAIWPAYVEDPYFTYVLMGEEYAVYAKDVYNLPYELVIPSTYKDKPITIVGGFSGAQIISVVIPEGVKVIESGAFRWCEWLTSVTLPESLDKIEDGAFAACGSLTSIRLPSENLYYIGELVFTSSYNLSEIIYCGSAADWDQIEKAETWNSDMMGEYTFYYHFYGEDNVCDHCEYERKGIHAVNIALGQDIVAKYYAIVSNPTGELTMVFTMNGKTVTVTGVATGKLDEYVFAFEGIAPQCMGDAIDAVLFDGENEIGAKEGFTVEAYLQQLLKGNYGDAVRELAIKTLYYGGAAQWYQNYNTDNVVSDHIDVSDSYHYDIPMDSDAEVFNGEGVTFTAASVYFDNVNRIRVKFTAEDFEDLIIMIDGEVVDYQLGADGKYYVMTDAIYASQFAQLHQIEAYANGELVSYLSYSVNSYIISKANSENAYLAELVQALYDYGMAASNCFN